MYEICKNVILNGAYELTDMLYKLKKFYAQSDLTEAEYDELTELAQVNADPDKSLPVASERISAIEDNVRDLTNRVEALEGKKPAVPEIKEWVQPTGQHDAYMKGDKCLYGGKKYQCTMDHNVYNPHDYPQGWTEIFD